MKAIQTIAVAAGLAVSVVLPCAADDAKEKPKTEVQPTQMTVVTPWKAEKVTRTDGKTELRVVVDPAKKLSKPETYVLPITASLLFRGGAIKVSQSGDRQSVEIVAIPSTPSAVSSTDASAVVGQVAQQGCHIVIQGAGRYCTGGCDPGKFCQGHYQDLQLVCGCKGW